jgi:hypothetical protein
MNTIENIVNKEIGGVDTQYILNHTSKKRIDTLVVIANSLYQQNATPFIEVKFVSRYSSREKRLEIVSRSQDTITIYKISAFSRYDKDAIDLNQLLEEIKSIFSNSEYKFCGVLLFKELEKIQFIKESLSAMNLNLNIGSY